MNTDFYLEKPRALGWRGLSLLIPSCASAIGFFSFAVLAFGFTELDSLPTQFRTGLVLIGAFSLAFGGEIGTLSNTVEIFRKNGQATGWDWASLVISVASTLTSFLLAFAALLGVKATWSQWLQLYGPVILGLVCALDSYGGFLEFGLYLNSFDERMKEWQAAFEQFKRQGFTERQEETDREKRIGKLLDIVSEDGFTPISQIAKELDVSRTTVYNDISELEKQNIIKKNGKGIEIINIGG